MEQVVNEALLKETAAGDEHKEVRKAAYEKLGDHEAALLVEAMDKHCWGNPVDNITDPSALVKLACEAPGERVAKEALKKLKDQNMLAQVAIQRKEGSIAQLALAQMTNERLIAEVAIKSQNYYLAEQAIKRVTSSDELCRAALSAAQEIVRLTAVKQITDQSVLTEIMRTERSEEILQAAVTRLTDQATIIEFALNAHYHTVRRKAIQNVTDQKVLSQIVRTELSEGLRTLAMERITDAGARESAQLVLDLISNSEPVFISALTKVCQMGSDGDPDAAVTFLRDAIRIRASDRDIKFYKPGLRASTGAEFMNRMGEAVHELVMGAGQKSLVLNPVRTGELIVSLLPAGPQVISEVLTQIYKFGGLSEGFAFQLLYNEIRQSMLAAERAN